MSPEREAEVQRLIDAQQRALDEGEVAALATAAGEVRQIGIEAFNAERSAALPTD